MAAACWCGASARGREPILLGFDDAFVVEACPPREFDDGVLRDRVKEVKAGLVGTDEHRSEIPDHTALVLHRFGGGVRTFLEIGHVPDGDIRLDQIRGHRSNL